MEEIRNIKRVGNYSMGQAEPEDCAKCHSAVWGTIIIDGLCLDCYVSNRFEPLVIKAAVPGGDFWRTK